jgi:hypothetical protein
MGSSAFAGTLWMQDVHVKPPLNFKKNLMIVYEFALYLLALKIKFKNKIRFISYLPILFSPQH